MVGVLASCKTYHGCQLRRSWLVCICYHTKTGIYNCINCDRGGNDELVKAFSTNLLHLFNIELLGNPWIWMLQILRKLLASVQIVVFFFYFFYFRYHEHIVWGDKDLKMKLLRKGILTRIYAPMVSMITKIFSYPVLSSETNSFFLFPS